MVVGTALVGQGGFSSLVRLSFGPVDGQVYAGVVGLAVNLAVIALASPCWTASACHAGCRDC